MELRAKIPPGWRKFFSGSTNWKRGVVSLVNG